MSDKCSIVALIPARSGSKRVPNKNIRLFSGHPLIAYTIAAAFESEIFSNIVVSTDSEEYSEVAVYYGANVPFLRPTKFSGGRSPDIEWVAYTLKELRKRGSSYDCFSILRPTSPFRRATTIKRAWEIFLGEQGIDSLRAVEKCAQHPAKMWFINNNRMHPVLKGENSGIPWHSNQYKVLPEIYVQNASLEIAWTRVVFEDYSISGTVIIPFLTREYEGFDLNHPYDWKYAEDLVKKGQASLPTVSQSPFPHKTHL